MASVLSAWIQLDDARHRAELYRMWRVAASAGFTIPHAMETLGPRESPDVESARRWLLDGTRRERTLTDLVHAAGAPFTRFEIALLAMGDESGRLEQSLRLLGDYHDRKQRLMLAVRKKLASPLFTAVCASFIAPFPLLWTGHAAAYAVTVLVACAFWATSGGVIVVGVAEHYSGAPRLVRARLARALAIAIEAGLPLGRALPLAAAASGDASITRFVEGVGARRLETQSIVTTMTACPRMTPEFLAVLANAERTGDFTGTLARLADLYEDGFR